MTTQSKNNLAIIFGSDTQMTEDIAERIALKLNVENISFKDVCSIKSSEILNYNPIIFGVPTWYVGELQSDWDVFFPEFEKIDFNGKKVAFFSLGDQYGYPDNFVDGLGILARVVLKNGGDLYGYWPNEGYDFTNSLGLDENGMFLGLVLDEDNQSDMSDERIDKWIENLKKDFNL